MPGYDPKRDKKPEGYEPTRAPREQHPHGRGVVPVTVPGWGRVVSREKRRPRTALIAEAAARKIAEREGRA